MAWAEKTFFNVDDPPDADADSERRINEMLKDLPPFMKLTSRKARKVLVRYEELKQRHIENLRNNQVFKFVMKVAGFTNENIEKYWKGSDISPFMEKYTPKNIKITKEDLDILVLRAREHALSDLHQFCNEIMAVPMYRPAYGDSDVDDPVTDPNINIPEHTALPDRPDSPNLSTAKSSKQKLIFNMSDAEFNIFCKKFLLMPKTVEKAYEPNSITWYILKEGFTPEEIQYVYDHTHVFKENKEQGESYDHDISTHKSIGLTEDPPPSAAAAGRAAADSAREMGNSNIAATNAAGNAAAAVARQNARNAESAEQSSASHFWTWNDNTPVIHWDKTTAEFWFQRYIAKWLTEDPDQDRGRDSFKDLTDFRDRFRMLFNNLRLDHNTGKWMRDLTGLRLTKMIRGRKEFKDRGVGLGRDQQDPPATTGTTGTTNAPPQPTRRQSSTGAPIRRLNNRDRSGIAVGVTNFEEPERSEGALDTWRPEDLPTEVPLDFVRPIFNERFAHWKHELVLGEYEKKSMQEADKWLQMTPWAIGKIYLQPSIYAHMQEAYIALTRKWKKFQHLTLDDWISSEEHSFFFSKLVALCIRTSAVLSGKKYGLDKVYMRLNLEKRRIMFAISKLEPPRRTATRGMSTLPDERAFREYIASRR